MELFPAIDLRGGQAVRLFQGDYDQMTVYSDNPLEVAKKFKADGAKYLHLVDLDGALEGNTPNFAVICDIVQNSGLLVELGGGIRSMEVVDRYISLGVWRVIIGTSAVTDPKFLVEAVKKYGSKIVVGIDVRDGFVAIHGWTKTSTLTCFDFCKTIQSVGVRTVICTDISKDGAMQGVNAELYSSLQAQFDMDFIASGGVTDISDLTLLSKINVAGAILGKSLYVGTINLKDAISATNCLEKI